MIKHGGILKSVRPAVNLALLNQEFKEVGAHWNSKEVI
jgi:hypothetical protein